MIDHCMDVAPGYEESMLEHPVFPAVNRRSGLMNLAVPMKSKAMREMFTADIARPLGFKPYTSGIYSLRKYSINKVLASGEIYLATSHASHKPTTDGRTIKDHYQGNNANVDMGSFFMGRERKFLKAE